MRVGKILPLIALLFLVACTGGSAENTELQGRVLLWHTWSGADEDALNELLDKFNDVYPEITVISISYTGQELREQFVDVALRGMGPDVIIGSQSWIPDLVDAGLIHALEEDRLDLSPFLDTALQSLRYRGELYGLPLSVQTSALYFNKDQVSEPPETLSALLEQADQGHKVVLNTNFDAAFWGIQAFGGKLLDEEMRVVLNQGGFANWLSWLIEASNAPNIILGRDEATLKSLFTEGEVAYYVGESSDLLEFQEALGEKVVGVSPLPAGPNDLAGPFLTTEPFFFGTDSSPAQALRSMLLVQFLTNNEQQRKLAEQTGRVPANAQARINRRISPAVAGFVEQSKTAIPLLLIPQMFDAIELGQDTYLQVLEGLADPTEATYQLTQTVNEKSNLETVETTTEVTCGETGFIEIWHAWPRDEAAVLEKIGERYSALCPGSEIVLTSVEAGDLFTQYRQAVQNGEGPDLLLISSEYAGRLASAELVSNVDDMVDPSFLQRYIPNVPEAMRFEGNLYGLPIMMDTIALYYNANLVSEPPVDLGDLLSQIGPDRQVALPYSPFSIAHWGITAFGGRLFDVEGNLTITDGRFEEWLQWLRESGDQPGMVLTRDQTAAAALFTQGEAIYFVGERAMLGDLQEQLGETRVRVAPLPAGPEGSSGPILDVQGLMFNPESRDLDTALAFAEYMAGTESQSMLMKDGNLMPANILVRDPVASPAITGFLDQATTAVVLSNRPETDTIFGLGDIIYANVLEQKAEPATVLEDFSLFFENVHSDDEAQTCDRAGELLLWHSLQGAEAAVLDQIIVDFARHCPDVQIQTESVPAQDLPSRLAVATIEGAAPDFFLAPHDLIEPLSEGRLIKPITQWVANSILIPYLPQATDALSYDTALYGLPYSVDTKALYYNTDLVDEPGSDIFDLFASTTITAPFAMGTSFEDAFWGALLFGGEPYSSGDGTEPARLDLNGTSFINWLGWLQSNQDRDGIVLGDDPEHLRELFAVGGAGYLVDDSSALAQLRAELDSEDGAPTKVGVSPLPADRAGQASPFLTVNGFLFGAESNEEQTQTALEFAKFTTSNENQVRLARTVNKVPTYVMALTLVDDSAIDAFIEQVQTSILLPSRPEMLVLGEAGDIIMHNVLENEQQPTSAMEEFTEYVMETPKPVIVAYAGEQVLTCEGQESLVLWHSLSFVEPQTEDLQTDSEEQQGSENALERIIASYQEYCPEIVIETKFVPSDDLVGRLAVATTEGDAPDIYLGKNDQIKTLADRGLIKSITSSVDQTFMSQFLPESVKSLEYEDELFGLPQTLDVAVLYYNADLVSTTVSTLDDLLEVASPETRVALHSSYYDAHWGIGAFGGVLFDADGELSSDLSGFEDWLTWLQTTQEHPDFVLGADQAALQQQFLDGNTAFLITGSSALYALRKTLGDNVRVISLPNGPEGEPSPLLSVDSFLFSTGANEEQTELALQFAEFAASAPNQQLLAQEFDLVPTSRLIAETTEDLAIGVAIKQAMEKAVIVPTGIDPKLFEALDEVYRLVLVDGLTPADAIGKLIEVTELQ